MSGVGARLVRASLALGGRRVLAGIDLDLAPGDKCLLLGANGAGKTQLLRLLCGERWPTPAPGTRCEWYDARGRLLDLPELKPRLVLLGGERQDEYLRHDWDFTLLRVVATGCHGTARPLADPSPAERVRVHALLRRLGLWRLRARRFLTLSYGERRLALLARSLAARPRLLLLDEPFNGLDATARARLEREVARLLRGSTTLVVAAHRVEDAPAGLGRLLVLDRGRLQRDTVAGDAARSAPRRLVAAGAEGRAAGERRDAPRSGSVASHPAAAGGAPPLVVLRRATLHRDYRPVLVDVDWCIGAGEHWAIVGSNGSGKTTLLRCLYGDLPVALGGSVERRGLARGAPIEGWKRRVGWVAPELQAEYLVRVDVASFVASGLRASVGLDAPATAAELVRARAALRTVGLRVALDRPAHELSYGQRRLALLARALAPGPEALLLDEPLTGLDTPARARMRTLLSRLARAGLQLVVAVHHGDDLVPEIGHVLWLRDGRALPGRRDAHALG